MVFGLRFALKCCFNCIHEVELDFLVQVYEISRMNPNRNLFG